MHAIKLKEECEEKILEHIKRNKDLAQVIEGYQQQMQGLYDRFEEVNIRLKRADLAKNYAEAQLLSVKETCINNGAPRAKSQTQKKKP